MTCRHRDGTSSSWSVGASFLANSHPLEGSRESWALAGTDLECRLLPPAPSPLVQAAHANALSGLHHAPCGARLLARAPATPAGSLRVLAERGAEAPFGAKLRGAWAVRQHL